MQLAKAVVTLNNCYQEIICARLFIHLVNLFFLEPNKNKIWIIANNIKNVNEIHVCKLICIKKCKKVFTLFIQNFRKTK